MNAVVRNIATAILLGAGCSLAFALPVAASTVPGAQSGGGTPSSTLSAVWAEDFAQAQRAASSDFERAVLADSTITADEYNEATDRFVECVQLNGLPAFAADDPHNAGLWSYALPSSSEAAAAQDQDAFFRISDLCAPGTNGLIEPLYVDLTTNPAKQDESTVRAQCLNRAGLVGPDYSAAEYNADQADDTFPFSSEAEAAVRCFINPSV